MNEQSVYYYPYASLDDSNLTMIKAIALYFDRLYILDPLKSRWSGIGGGPFDDQIKLLEDEGILVRIAPETVMHQYESSIAAAIKADIADSKFVDLCNQQSTGTWTLALAKVPEEIRNNPKYKPVDQSMRHILSDVGTAYAEIIPSASTVYDEYRETMNGVIEYRYADYPFFIGEAIMLNHALVGSLLYKDAVPITNEAIHSKLLNYKLQQAQQIPEIKDVLEQRQKKLQFAHASAAIQALTDLQLGVIPTEITVEQILKYRDKYQDELNQARSKLAWMSREISETPWTMEFDDEVSHKLIPELHAAMEPAKQSWSSMAKLAGIALGGAAVALGIFGSPLTPVAVGVAGLTVAKDVGLGGFDWYQDWKKGTKQNGLHYLLKVKNI